MTWLRFGLFVFVLFVAMVVSLGAEAPRGFLHDGDVWVFMGDSITDAGPYRDTLERVCRFYHPQATFTFSNQGVSGSLATAAKEQFEKATAGSRPTIASLMTGMNNTINSAWRQGDPVAPNIDDYRHSIQDIVRRMKANGLTVILMGPTYTDESLGWGSLWELAGTSKLLATYNTVVEEIAKQEHVLYLPVGTEFEAAQQRLKPEQVLRHDGVHPHAVGQYQIAGTIIHHLPIAGPLDGNRQAVLDQDCPVDVSLTASRITPGAADIPLSFATDHPGAYTLTWSYRESGHTYPNQTAMLTMTGHTPWTLPLPVKLPVEAGQAGDILLEVKQKNTRRLYRIDLVSVRVLHPIGGVLTGSVDAPTTRPEGKRVANWTLSFLGKAMVFEAEVFDDNINQDFIWPWGRDGINLYLDLRPADRFAQVGQDSDVYQTIFNVHEQPFFGVTHLDWTGRSITAASTVSCEHTPAGYKIRFALAGKLSKWNVFDASGRDFIGFAPVFVDLDPQNKLEFYPAFPTQRPLDQFANGMAIVDLKQKIVGDLTVNVDIHRL